MNLKSQDLPTFSGIKLKPLQLQHINILFGVVVINAKLWHHLLIVFVVVKGHKLRTKL